MLNEKLNVYSKYLYFVYYLMNKIIITIVPLDTLMHWINKINLLLKKKKNDELVLTNYFYFLFFISFLPTDCHPRLVDYMVYQLEVHVSSTRPHDSGIEIHDLKKIYLLVTVTVAYKGPITIIFCHLSPVYLY